MNKKNETLTHVDQDGIAHTYDAFTGELIQRSDQVPEYKRYKYSLEMAEVIYALVRQGYTLTKIGAMDGMPPASVIYRWSALHPDFHERLDMARTDRAEYFHDKVIECADAIETIDDSRVAKVRMEAYKWAAERGNKERYSSSTKLDLQGESGIIVFDTGIRRDNPIEVDYTEVDVECDVHEQVEHVGSFTAGDSQEGGLTASLGEDISVQAGSAGEDDSIPVRGVQATVPEDGEEKDISDRGRDE